MYRPIKMTNQIFRVSGLITNCAKNINIKNNAAAVNLLKPHVPLMHNARDANFFTKRPANLLWKSVISVSNAGKRRGRAKSAPKIRDLNKGQKIGFGKAQLMFPGLNSLIRLDTLIPQKPIPLNPSGEAEVLTTENEYSTRKRQKISSLDRGWSGSKLGGRKLGPPDPIDGETFDGFQTWILHIVRTSKMTSIFGRSKRCIAFVVTGNGKGLAGFSSTTASEPKTALSSARNKAGQRLMYIERYNDHTVLHNFFTQFGRTKIFVRQMPQGYGLVCHRIIKTCCEAIGIKDLYAKVEGSKNAQNIIKAFFIGLIRQKTYQQMADEKKLHLIEMKKEHNYFPTVLASPETVRKSNEIKHDEILDFDQYIMDGRVVLRKKKLQPFYTKLPSYTAYLRKAERRRDHDNVRLKLKAEYGEIRSFLTEKYPEAKHCRRIKKEEDDYA
ncbi:mitochondrial ribosomal protein S5 [Colletes latitarsis]|uniref:mitochondrial ribosomal protein S5 n=1 Tax=Colletes latitarsis TaxID=2605962 RepID=UPI00403644E5